MAEPCTDCGQDHTKHAVTLETIAKKVRRRERLWRVGYYLSLFLVTASMFLVAGLPGIALASSLIALYIAYINLQAQITNVRYIEQLENKVKAIPATTTPVKESGGGAYL